MSRRGWWRTGFLSVTALALGLEIYASADGSSETDPWTDMIVTYIPGEVTALAVAGLAGWLGIHFGKRYLRKARANRGGEGDDHA